jgi:hypothetical protein
MRLRTEIPERSMMLQSASRILALSSRMMMAVPRGLNYP